MKKDTSWGGTAIVGEYQKTVILPNLLRLLEIKKGEIILDLACGSGFFSREFTKFGAKVIGAEISKELIAAAKENAKGIEYHVASADNLNFLSNASVDKITIILSIQNIDNVAGVFKECARVLRPQGKIFLVLNHPAFRVPKESDWGWDESKKVQYRRVDQYLSESKVKIQMHPSTGSGQVPKLEDYTISFHRPLQFYFKLLSKSGLAVARLEEWNSNRKSEAGPREKAEDTARKEIPLFLFMEVVKIK